MYMIHFNFPNPISKCVPTPSTATNSIFQMEELAKGKLAYFEGYTALGLWKS